MASLLIYIALASARASSRTAREFWAVPPKMLSPVTIALQFPGRRWWSVIWFLLLVSVCSSLLRLHHLTGTHLQLFNYLGLLHQDWELPNAEWYYESAQLMFQPALIFSAPSLLR